MKKPYPLHQSITVSTITVLPIILLSKAALYMPLSPALQIINGIFVLTLCIILSITIVNILNYHKAKQIYPKSQYFMMYKQPFSVLIKSDTLFTHYRITQILLKQYADHAEILNHLSIKHHTQPPIDLLLLHKRGIFAINISNPDNETVFKRSIKTLETKIHATIYDLPKIHKNKLPALINIINKYPIQYQQSEIHNLYDIILTFAHERVQTDKHPT